MNEDKYILLLNIKINRIQNSIINENFIDKTKMKTLNKLQQ